ncbi:alpha-2-macroglobulin family protein [Candidatus Ulvibacter alkanivorans]|uniref:alpha-2-macroglobulin family protein n=1 Tax=Candidatus Ulvibacter alkanivorans TaxID=2267620 RepID=UPI000DF4A356|nr:MG2 domain-containing protein [Candidatus Ulvibacter alkanivorans]
MKKLQFSFAVTFVFLLFSCGKKDTTSETDNLFAFKEYISFHTHGNQSVANPIRIELAQPLENYELSQELPQEYVTIRPKIAGSLYIENGRSLVFQPSEQLKRDTEYTVTVQLVKLYEDIAPDYRKFTFSFKTLAPHFKIDLDALQSYSKQWQYVTGSLQTSDLISLSEAQQILSVSQSNKNLNIKWPSETKEATYFNFTVDSIQRTVNDSKITVSWDGSPIDSENKGSNTFDIPGQNAFKVIDLETTMAPQASVAINFSDPLMADQDFNGLVVLENAPELRFEVDGNLLYVYPSNSIVGEVRLDLFNGIKNSDGFSLQNEVSELISFDPIKPGVRLVSQGVILPNAASTPLYFEAVNLSAVDVRVVKIYEQNMLQFLQTSNLNDATSYEIRRVGRRIAKKTIILNENSLGQSGLWKAYAVNLSELFAADPGAMYRVELSFKKEYSTYDCDADTNDLAINDTGEDFYEDDYYYNESFDSLEDEDAREERYWDNEIYNWRNYRYNWEQRDNPCHDAYYSTDRFASTNVLGSDIGMIVKKGNNNSYHFAVTNLLTAKPEAGVRIKLYNFQQRLIETIKTDGDGLGIYDSERTVAFAVAQKGNNISYIKLQDGNALSLSKFDVSGKQLQKGLKGFLYTERGVHRPGDSIHLTFVLNDEANRLPKGHPVKLEVTDARGQLVQQTVLNESEQKVGSTQALNGFYYFPIATDAAAPTGNWNATISVGSVRFSKSLKVATVKPNRLKINLDLTKEVLSTREPIRGTVKANWLHGAPGRNLTVEMDATLRSTTTVFKNFAGYDFTDPIRKFNEVELPILKTTLSSEGTRDFSKDITLSNKAPGMLKATFLTKVFEGGGDFSIDVFSKNLAPYTHFVGLRSPETHRYGSYYTDENTVFDVATVDENGVASGNRELEVKVFRIEWRWWWNRGEDNLSRYENATVHRPVKDFKVTTNNNGQASFTLNIPEEQGGRYLIRVIDKASGHATGRITYFYRNWSQRPSGGDAESSKMLVFSSDKESYKVGEEAIITFPSGSEGRALISVENGTEVLATHWIETKKSETKAAIRLTDIMAPNIYVNISLLQPHAQTKNDLPIRLYGVIPILVENPKTILKPKLEMPKVLKPEETFTVSVSEANNQPMTYTIAMVDEGLLDLTRFKTPTIHNAFYTREALGVRTFDIFDDVIGAFSGNVDNIYAIGGGDVAAGAKNRKADRFKPVVKYLGPFELKAGEKTHHQITMPNYVGSVRTMLIAGNNDKSAYGKTDVTTPVRKPLMVLASLPRKLSPGEKVTLPVTVFAMERKVKNVQISINTGEALKPLESTTKNISFSETGEKIVNFTFEVLPANHFQTIEVVASGGGERASYKVAIDVENPNPIFQKTTTYTLSENASETINFETYGVAGTNGATLEFSTAPPMDFNKRLSYLIQYPHGCIEQTTSGAFPQLYLADIFDLTFERKKTIEQNVTTAIQRLANFQVASGGLSYWPGERAPDYWSTNYAGHFMLEAKQKGYALPITFLSNWLQFQKKEAREWRNTDTSYNSSLIQAYRLYTLALAGQPELAAMNRLRESSRLSNDAKWRLAAAYALAGKESVAREITRTANINFEPKAYDHYTYGSSFRNKAMALETLVLLDDEKQREMAISVAKELASQRWYSTQETAYSLLSLAKMIHKNGGKAMNLNYINNGKTVAVSTEKALSIRELDISMGSNSVSISNNKANTVYVTLIQQGKMPLGDEIAEKNQLAIKASYLDGAGNPLDVTNLRQGTEIIAKVLVTNTSNDYVDNIALTKIFPGGWEIVNTSFTELAGGTSGNARYTDIRDDRVHFYFDLKAKQSKTFSVKLNASYLGTYYLPGTQVEAMYDANYFARNKGIWVTIEQ